MNLQVRTGVLDPGCMLESPRTVRTSIPGSTQTGRKPEFLELSVQLCTGALWGTSAETPAPPTAPDSGCGPEALGHLGGQEALAWTPSSVFLRFSKAPGCSAYPLTSPELSFG